MNSQKGYVVNVIVTGLMAVVVLSTLLFVGRFFCLNLLLESTPPEMARAGSSPSGLLGEWDKRPDAPVTEPNAVVIPSLIEYRTSPFLVSQSLGIFNILRILIRIGMNN